MIALAPNTPVVIGVGFYQEKLDDPLASLEPYQLMLKAIRDAARVLDYPYSTGDQLAKAMPPPILGKDATIDQCLNAPGQDASSDLRDHFAAASGLRDLLGSLE